MNEPSLYVEDLRKSYATVVAVDGLTFQVERGEIFGLLGPNGAGKTTTIRILMDIFKPDAGTVRVLGQPPGAARQRVGYLPEERGLYRALRVSECLTYLGQLKGMARAAAQRRAEELLERVELADWGKRKVEELSRGMQQKAQLAASLIHDPDLIILDEPFQGLDPVNAEMIRGIIRDLRAQGKTIVLSAHEMSLVEMLCERIVLINHGRAVLNGRLADLKKQFSPNAIEISPPLPVEGWPGVASVALEDGRQRVTLTPGAEPRDLLREIFNRGLSLDRFERATATLDEIFVTVVRGEAGHERP
ncbi:MAG: ATP-binding cassette domain-containing protein [Anaerolineales bacterium]|nr:ATP-binding cassette domain-containing protein [Anaerolineales bacterium]